MPTQLQTVMAVAAILPLSTQFMMWQREHRSFAARPLRVGPREVVRGPRGALAVGFCSAYRFSP
jgi:hypothetical protein